MAISPEGLNQDAKVAETISDYVHKHKIILGHGLETNQFIPAQEKQMMFTVFDQLKVTHADIERCQLEQQRKNAFRAELGNLVKNLSQEILGLTIEKSQLVASDHD